MADNERKDEKDHVHGQEVCASSDFMLLLTWRSVCASSVHYGTGQKACASSNCMHIPLKIAACCADGACNRGGGGLLARCADPL
eukprot:1141134-Pelagomonas_calceolata.AAC.3